jgi:iron complex transport system substrate-binding protein
MPKILAIALLTLSGLAPVKAAEPPKRIVSLLPSLTESVCALGACDRLIATDRWSNWPHSVQALPKVGGLDDAQIERIVALKPDLVLAAESSRAVERLRSLGLTVRTLEARSHGEVRDALQRLATWLGRPDEASRLWQRIEADLATAAARVPAGWRGRRVYFEADDAPYAAGPTSFIGETLGRLGLRNIVPAELGPFPKLNPEFILRAQPDLMMGRARAVAAMPRRPGWGRLEALRRQQLCSFDEERYDPLVRPGPRMGEAALSVASCLATLTPP